MKEKRIFDILTRYLANKPEQEIALAKKQNKSWVAFSIKKYVEMANAVSFALIKLGIKPKDKIAIINNNCPEWNIMDMAILQVGAITVPIYPTISQEDYRYILNDCGVNMIIMEGCSVIQKIEKIRDEIKSLNLIYTFSPKIKDGSKSYPCFDDLVELGRNNPNNEELENRKAAVKENDCATIIYTSGTTGNPKGVMLSHSNILNQIANLIQTPDPKSTRAFSFLPLCHAYERLLVYMYQYLFMSVYYAENIGSIVDNMREVHPTMMCAVPRVLEKIYNKVLETGKNKKGISKTIFLWSIRLAEKYTIDPDSRSWLYNQKLKIADKLVYNKIRLSIGGDCFDIIVSGAASLKKEISAFFSAIKMPVYEGYGMTECSPVITTSSNVKYGREAGFVGPAIPGVELKVSEDGELLCRGYNVMLGYYNKPELTAEVIDKDGWFHTGDLGSIDEHGLVKITGRMKSLFKTSLGKYINPEIIENKFCESGFIENMVVVGENQKFAAALIIPDFAFLKNWCKKHKIDFTTPAEMIKVKEIRDRFAVEIKKINENFGDVEKIKKYTLIADEWTVANGMLTPTLKIKRKVVMQKYKEQIDKLF